MLDAAILGLSRWAVSRRWENLPGPVADAIGQELAGLFAVISGGQATPAQRALVAAWAPEPGPCTLFGAGSASVEAAAWLNTVAGVCLERDSGHRLAKGHPAALAIPAVLALAEQRGTDGPRTLTAAVVAYEVAARLGRATSYEPDHHNHGSLGIPGAAAGCAVLLGLDAEGVARAVHAALASPVASSWGAALAGSPVRDQWAGAGALAGLASARLAVAGETLPGTWPSPAVGSVKPDGLVPTGDDSDLMVGHGYVKRHSSCAYTHAPADAALLLRADLLASGITPEQIRSIEVVASPAAVRLDATSWTTRHGAYFSTPFAVASALLHGDVSYERSAPAQAARLTPLAALVRLREGPLATPDARPATVRVVTDTGSVYEVAVPHSLGDRDHSPFDAATHHDLLAAALTSAGPAPFGPDLVVDVVAALPTAASAATELARLRLAEPERKP